MCVESVMSCLNGVVMSVSANGTRVCVCSRKPVRGGWQLERRQEVVVGHLSASILRYVRSIPCHRKCFVYVRGISRMRVASHVPSQVLCTQNVHTQYVSIQCSLGHA